MRDFFFFGGGGDQSVQAAGCMPLCRRASSLPNTSDFLHLGAADSKRISSILSFSSFSSSPQCFIRGFFSVYKEGLGSELEKTDGKEGRVGVRWGKREKVDV